jgi:CDGSH-type Zn-finger protein
MARLIRNEHTGPYKIEPKDFPTNGKSIFICACGLSNKMPYCDGTHKACLVQEQPGNLYTYDMRTKQITGSSPDDAASVAPANSPPAPPIPPTANH